MQYNSCISLFDRYNSIRKKVNDKLKDYAIATNMSRCSNTNVDATLGGSFQIGCIIKSLYYCRLRQNSKDKEIKECYFYKAGNTLIQYQGYCEDSEIKKEVSYIGNAEKNECKFEINNFKEMGRKYNFSSIKRCQCIEKTICSI